MGDDTATAEPAIRAYREGDFATVRALWDACRLIVPHNDPAKDIAFCRAAADAELFVGEESGRLTATIMTGHDGHRGWLYYLAVDPARRHRGLGRRMVGHAEAWLERRGVAKVNLMIRDGNTGVVEFYEAVGYAREPRVVMSRFLADKPGRGAVGLEAGKLEIRVTYLEMTQPPAAPAPPPPAAKLALLRAERPTVAFYRFLYNAVGGPWLWWERRQLADDDLAAIVHDPMVEITVLYVGGVPAGFSELDRRQEPDIELAYFGLMPKFIGRGLGRYLLRRAVDQAWTRKPRRLWVHTCDLDHPRSLAVYRRAGFVPYRQTTEVIDDPRLTGIFTAASEPPNGPGSG